MFDEDEILAHALHRRHVPSISWRWHIMADAVKFVDVFGLFCPGALTELIKGVRQEREQLLCALEDPKIQHRKSLPSILDFVAA